MDALKDTNSEETVLQHGFQFHSSENGINFPVGKVDLSTLTKDGRVSGKVMKRLMLCKVAIGRAYNANEDFAKIAAIPDGYDSFVIDREGERKSDSSSSSSSGNNNNKQEKGRRNRHQQRPQRDEDSEDDEHGGHECAAESHPESFNYVIKDSSQILPTFVVVFEYDPEAERRSRQKVTCENCERRVATVFCQSDAANLCDQCDAEMHSSKLASRHTRVPLEGNGAQTFSHCRIHPDKIVEFFCPSCSRPVCVHCKMVGHHSTGDAARHKLITIAEAFKSVAESANSVDPILESRKAAIHAQKESVDERAKQVIANADAIQSQLDEIYQRAQADLKALLKKKLNVLRGDVVELDRELAEIRQLEAFLEYQKSGPNATQFILDWSHHQRLRTELHSFPFFRESIDVLPDIRVNGSIQVHVESALHAGGGFGMSMADFGGEKRFSGVGAAAAASGRPRATPTIDLSAYKIRKATEYVADLNLNAVAPNAATPQYSVTTASHDRQPSVK